MYNERDRVGTRQIALVLGGIILGILAIGAVASVLLGTLLRAPSNAATSEAQPAQSVATSGLADAAPATPSPPAVVTQTPAPSQTSQPQVSQEWVVAIDAGHQKRGDSSLEPVGPGASEKKAKVAGGARGVSTGNSESSINLAVSKCLRDQLESRGVRVVMIRTKQDVNVSNAERAEIANEADADLFIRLHCDGSGDNGTKGLSTLIPKENKWTKPIVSESRKAGKLVHKAVIASTGAKDRGVRTRGDLSGFNWAEVPTVLIEMGFMSNVAEDQKLGTPEYQQALAEGMAAGVMDYLESQ